jgi:hypothetical protein
LHPATLIIPLPKLLAHLRPTEDIILDFFKPPRCGEQSQWSSEFGDRDISRFCKLADVHPSGLAMLIVRGRCDRRKEIGDPESSDEMKGG